MSTPMDRVEAQEIADLLGISVEVIPEDQESLTIQLCALVGLGEAPLPESLDDRWEMISQVLANDTFGLLGRLL